MAATHKKAGVDIETGNELAKRIKKEFPKIRDFGGLYSPEGTKYNLVGSADGVDAKLKIAFLTGKHDIVGIDLVCCGAKPLFYGLFYLRKAGDRPGRVSYKRYIERLRTDRNAAYRLGNLVNAELL